MKKPRKKKRTRKQSAAPSPDPAFAAISSRQKETVVELILSGRTVEKALEVGMSALIWAEHALARFDAESDLPRPLACHTGCDYCCFNQVELTPPEVLVIGHFIDRHFLPEEKAGLRERLSFALEAKSGKDKRQIARIRRTLPCPLLQAQRCSVYPVRPLVCRAMHSLDASQCQNSLISGDLSSGAYYLPRHGIVQAIVRGLQDGGRALGCQADSLDLARALQDYFQQPNPMEDWIRGDKVFSPA